MAVERQDRREAVLIHLTPEVKRLARIADGNGRSRKREMERVLSRHASRLSEEASHASNGSHAGGQRQCFK